MKVLLIGYGSIGRKHYKILDRIKNITRIDIVTKQKLPSTIKTYEKLSEINDLSCYDYFVIASETYKHYRNLKAICYKVSGKKILVEKPLFDKVYEDFKHNGNEIYVAYNLRYNYVIKKIKELVLNNNILTAHIYCGQFLPHWRPKTDYRLSYSASAEKGGGVLRDLSHELDYSTWIFGQFDSFSYLSDKISDLEITSDDVYHCLGRTKSGVLINLSIDYLSKKPMRSIVVHLGGFSIYANLIDSTIEKVNSRGESQLIEFENDSLSTYRAMHNDILFSNGKNACTFNDGYQLLNFFKPQLNISQTGESVAEK